MGQILQFFKGPFIMSSDEPIILLYSGMTVQHII